MPRILLVEDNEMNRDMLSRRLARRGFTVSVASDGAQALALARTLAPDLILMDLRLPDISGWDVTRTLKIDPLTSATPIIALSAQATDGEREKALAAGCDDYTTKPIDLEHLLARIQHNLRHSG